MPMRRCCIHLPRDARSSDLYWGPRRLRIRHPLTARGGGYTSRMSRKRPMLTGPNSERRPTSPVAAAVSAMEEIVTKYEVPPEDGEPAAGPDPRSRDVSDVVPDVLAERSEWIPA